MLHSVVRLMGRVNRNGMDAAERMSGERTDPPVRNSRPPLSPMLPEPPVSGLGRWTRRRLLVRLAAALGAAVAVPLVPSFVLPTEARELVPARSACACGGGRVQARAPQVVGAERSGRAQQAVRTFENRIGWAYSPRWRKSRTEVVADLRRMRDLGCNTIYIGHNSAGDTNPDAYEPGLAPSNWYAIAAATPSAADARIVVSAVNTSLDAAREVGLDVVLGIGYQIMMGDEWNDAHPDDLRLNRNGDLLKHWGSVFTASPYSEVYRRDIREYYGWINQTFVLPNPHVVALNLADEPMGSDFSSHAMAAFQARYGVSFQAATNAQRGEFLTGVIPDYAAWSANFWDRLNPDVRTMMTFHVQRDAPFLPDVERIFAQTPPSFVFSEDTHLDDGLIDRAITAENVRLLYGMCRTFGWLSQVYGKSLMLWTAANAWGLKRNGGLAEARQNLDIVHDATRQAGGEIGMLMAWGWNIKFQGVYDDEGNFAADKDSMIAGVSQMLADRRERLSVPSTGRPDRVYHLPSATLTAAVGEKRFDHLAEGIVDLSRIDFVTENAVYLTDGRALDEARRLGIPITPL
jgi:hypothetical protein